MFIQSEEDVKVVYETFEKEYKEVFSQFGVFPQAGVDLETFALRAEYPSTKVEMPKFSIKGETPPTSSLKGKRDVYWDETSAFRPTNIYEQGLLEAGNLILNILSHRFATSSPARIPYPCMSPSIYWKS